MQEGKDKDEKKINHNRWEVRGMRKVVRNRALSGEIHNISFFCTEKWKATWLAV